MDQTLWKQWDHSKMKLRPRQDIYREVHQNMTVKDNPCKVSVFLELHILGTGPVPTQQTIVFHSPKSSPKNYFLQKEHELCFLEFLSHRTYWLKNDCQRRKYINRIEQRNINTRIPRVEYYYCSTKIFVSSLNSNVPPSSCQLYGCFSTLHS